MKLSTLLLFLFLSTSAFSQSSTVNVIFKGKIIRYDPVKIGYLYYAFSGETFTKKNSIQFDSTLSYRWELFKTSYKNKVAGEIFFSLDSNQNPTKKYAVVQKINLSEILKYARSKGLKSISLPNDLLLDYVSTEGVYKEAMDMEKNYVGTYIGSDKKEKIELQLVVNLFKWNFQPDNDFMNYQEGTWSQGDNKIIFDVALKMNTRFGTMKNSRETISFIINEAYSTPTLVSMDKKKSFKKLDIQYEYLDMNNNKYIINQDSVQYIPITKEQSSSGIYSGGEPAHVKIYLNDYLKIETLIKLMQQDTDSHLSQREKPSVLVSSNEDVPKKSFIISTKNSDRQELDIFLRGLIR